MTPTVHRHEHRRTCECSHCRSRSTRTRCGRYVREVYWTVGASPIRYYRRRDAVAVANGERDA